MLRRKTFEVLRYLVERPGQLVTKDASLDAVWDGAAVGDTMPSLCVGELRKVLEDTSKSPRFIETVYGRGYRFIASVRQENSVRSEQVQMRPLPNSFVGREPEMAQLRAALGDAASSRGRLFLISGEPGVGKSRLAQEVAVLASAKKMELLTGHCSHQDEAVAYLPFVEILENILDREQTQRRCSKHSEGRPPS